MSDTNIALTLKCPCFIGDHVANQQLYLHNPNHSRIHIQVYRICSNTPVLILIHTHQRHYFYPQLIGPIHKYLLESVFDLNWKFIFTKYRYWLNIPINICHLQKKINSKSSCMPSTYTLNPEKEWAWFGEKQITESPNRINQNICFPKYQFGASLKKNWLANK